MNGEKVLPIEIFQPYAQYRNPFTFYYAQTFPLPPKTTIIGMLQNATNRYYDESFWELKVSIHGGFESVFWNYQQLIKGTPRIGRWGKKTVVLGSNDNRPLYGPFKSQRTPVYQQELFNGHLYIFLKGDQKLLEEIKEALKRPKKILYLGRSEDVVHIRVVGANEGGFIEPAATFEFEKSLRLTHPTYLLYKDLPLTNQKYPVYSIPVYSVFMNEGESINDKAQINSKTSRNVKFETVIYTGFDFNLRVKTKEPINFEEYNFCGKKFRILDRYGWL